MIWAQSGASFGKNTGIFWKVVVTMVSSPLANFLPGLLIMGLLMALISSMNSAGGWMARISRPRWVNAFFGKAQIFSAAYMGLAHGTNDAQKNPRALKWSVIERIAWAWILTIPAAGGIAWGLVRLLRNYGLA